MMTLKYDLGLLVSLLCCSMGLQSAEIDLLSMKTVFTQGAIESQIKAIKTLEWSGIEDVSVFDQIEKNVLAHYQTAEGKLEVEWVVWGVKALSFSGNKNYLASIDEAAANGNHRRIRAYAEQSHAELLNRVLWNRIINREVAGLNESPEIIRFINMLASDVPELNRLAAKRVVYQHINNPAITSVLREQLEQVRSRAGSNIESDAAAWLVKALAESGCLEQGGFIRELADTARDKKLRKHARKISRSCGG